MEKKELKRVMCNCCGNPHWDNSLCQHDFRFSHYENQDFNYSTTNAYFHHYAIMICKNCGLYIKQLI